MSDQYRHLGRSDILSWNIFGDKVGLSFQQVQKYEKGINRVGAARLQR
jgi:hypothetical protein